MRYIAHIIGSGEGCDYTIGCNVKVVDLRSSTAEKARDEVEIHLDEGDWGSLDQIDRVFIYEVPASIQFDMEGFRRERAERRQRKKAREKETQDRAEYERLKKKFEP